MTKMTYREAIRAALREALQRDWLHQAGQHPTPERIQREIGWAREMAERVQHLLGSHDTPLIATFHATCGRILRQDPAAGMQVAPGSAVAFVVSLGPAPVAVPDVTGLFRAAAVSVLAAAGLVPGSGAIAVLCCLAACAMAAGPLGKAVRGRLAARR